MREKRWSRYRCVCALVRAALVVSVGSRYCRGEVRECVGCRSRAARVGRDVAVAGSGARARRRRRAATAAAAARAARRPAPQVRSVVCGWLLCCMQASRQRADSRRRPPPSRTRH